MRFQKGGGLFQRASCPFCNSINYLQSSDSFDSKKNQRLFLDEKKRKDNFPYTPPSLHQKQSQEGLPHSFPIVKDSKEACFPPNSQTNSKKGFHGIVKNFLRKVWALQAVDRKKKLFILLISSPLLLSFSLALLFLSFYFLPSLYLSQEPLAYIKSIENRQPNQIVGSEGELVAELFSSKTSFLKGEDIPQSMKDIIVFIEDQYFYEHGGIHWPSLLRAALYNIFSLAYRQGASTITQQLSRILLLEKEKTLLRKCREASLAYALEREMSKEEILRAYLNLVYLGHGAYGVGNASEFYFQRPLSELNFAQQFILASLPSAPERYSPLRHPPLLKVKMGIISERMREEGFPMPYNYPEQVRTSFYDLNRSPSANVYHDRVDHAPYITEYIRQKIGNLLGEEYMYNAGLRIETSIDLSLQKASVEEARNFASAFSPRFPPRRFKDGRPVRDSKEEKLSRLFQELSLGLMLKGYPQLKNKSPRLQTASLGIENKTGKILFLHGGSSFGVNNQLNRAIDMYRQTGSAIKPIIYALAIEKGILHAATLLEDRPIFEHRKIKEKEQKDPANKKRKSFQREKEKDYWTPGNYGGLYEGSVSVRRALSHSKNLPAIQAVRLLGMKSLREGFGKFFFSSEEQIEKRFRADDTLAIGSLEMSPFEMALAYSALGNNGHIQSPRLILAVYDARGEEIYNFKDKDEFQLGFPEKRQVLGGDTAEIVLDLLSGASRRGGLGAEVWKASPIVGKTGTSNDYRDAWFVGLSPDITAVVWVGFDEPSFSMPGGTGANLAGPLWGRIMRHRKPSKESFKFSPRAKSAKICPLTGLMYDKNCPVKSQRELFRRKDNLQKLLSKTEQKKRKKESDLNFSDL